MKNPKTVCREHGLYSFQAMRGAEAMMRAISEDVLHILLTTDVRPIHERVAEYFNLNKLSHGKEKKEEE